MKKYIFTTLSGLLLAAFIPALSSCSKSHGTKDEKEEPVEPPVELPIGFRGLDVHTRADGLATIYDSFCVLSFKVNADGTKSLVMPDYLVNYVDGNWVYYGQTGMSGTSQLQKYWDLSADSYTFAAVTPTSAAGSTFSIDDNGRVSINMADLTTDWMIARTIRRGVNDAPRLLDYDDIAEKIEEIDKSAEKSSAIFPTPGSAYAEVPLNFHRILAKVVIKVYADSETELTPLEVGFNNIGIAPATYNSATGWTTTPLAYQELYNQNTIITTEQNSRETALQITEIFVIPQQQTDATNSSLVQIKVRPNHRDDLTRKFNIPVLWEQNNLYTYYLKFEGGETGEIILFDVTVEPFGKGDESENKQTNW